MTLSLIVLAIPRKSKKEYPEQMCHFWQSFKTDDNGFHIFDKYRNVSAFNKKKIVDLSSNSHWCTVYRIKKIYSFVE